MKMESNKAFHRTAHKAPPVNADVPRDCVARNAALTSFAACPAPGAGTGRFTKFGWLSAGCACYHPAKLVSAALCMR